MTLDHEKLEDHIIVRMMGRLDTVNSRDFEIYIDRLFQNTADAIVIDMAGVDYVASSGLRSLLIAAKQMRAAHRDLTLTGLQPHVREVFDISGFSTIFKIA